MAISTLSSPGVEVKELDNSLRVTNTNGTTIYIPGFAAQGPVEEVNHIGSMEDFETLYGTPTNMAECYFYYTTAAVLENSGPGTNVLVYRLPYGEGEGDNVAQEYTMLAYPAIPVSYERVEGEKKWWPIGSSHLEKSNVEVTVDSSKYTIGIKVFSSNKDESASSGTLMLDAENAPKFKIDDDELDFIDSKNYTKACKLAGKDNFIVAEFSGDIKNIIDALKTKEEPQSVEIEFGDAWSSDSISVESTFNGSTDEKKDITYLIGAPVTHQLTLNEYYELLTGEIFGEAGWSNEVIEITKSEDGETSEKLYDLTKLSNISHAAFIVVNISRNIIDSNYQGYYIGISDNYFNVADDVLYSDSKTSRFNSINTIKFTNEFDGTSELSGTNKYQHINQNRLGFYLDQNYTGSISRVMQTEITKFDTSSELYDDTLNIGIFRLTKSTSNTNVLSLNYSISESYNAAFGKERIQSVGTSTATKSYFIENETSNSMLMSIFVNPNISENIMVDTDNILHGKIRVYGNKLIEGLNTAEKKYLDHDVKSPYTAIQSYINIVNRLGVTSSALTDIIKPLIESSSWIDSIDAFNNSALYGFGKFTTIKNSTKKIGNVPAKVKRALKFVSNDEVYPDLDIVLEAGLGTIHAYAKLSGEKNEFVDDVVYAAIEDLRTGRNTITEAAEDVKEDYMNVQQAFMSFADSFQNGGRGDTFYIADVLRGILIKGKNTKVTQLFGSTLNNSVYEDENVNHSWSTSIYHPINHLLDTFTTSYASVYAQWFKVNDQYTNGKIWVPSCGYVAALMARADANYGPWYAAAGYNRGIITGVLDCAINPDQSQRDDLYKICVNSIPKIGNIGVTIWGIRTMSKKASCFDQNTCRRTFLHMEKTIKRYLRYYVFEPNNSYTQIAIYNDLDPYLEGIKNRGGIYSYTLICDDTVNTDEIVNDGEMVVRCEAAPTRTAEKIVLEMVANRKNSTVTAV